MVVLYFCLNIKPAIFISSGYLSTSLLNESWNYGNIKDKKKGQSWFYLTSHCSEYIIITWGISGIMDRKSKLAN